MNIQFAFKMPTTAIATAISARSSTITAAFVSSILPVVQPTDDEILEALQILAMEPDDVRCAYCGEKSSEWDHLRPIVTDQKPTGFISEIRNLVPSCGKCNQSKGKKHWREWMLSSAKGSPKMRKVADLHERIARLESYEKWGNLMPIDFRSIVPSELWQEHWANMRRLHDNMKSAQELALRVRKAIEDNILRHQQIGNGDITDYDGNASIKELLSRAVRPESVREVGVYTIPRTYGVYKVALAGHCFRFGNHPIRKMELIHEYGKDVSLEALFTEREYAKELANLLNKSNSYVKWRSTYGI